MMRCVDWISMFISFITSVQGNFRSSPRIKSCSSDLDCDVILGFSCHWLFNGCQVGQCMCDPRRHRRLPNGKCVPIKFGDERCSHDDVCIHGMSCQRHTCQCDVGVMTSDAEHCLRHHHRLLGQSCDVNIHTCYQKTASGYTKNGVSCSGRLCSCAEGSKAHGLSCRNLKVNEYGCSKFFHCQGGAVCVDSRCICPTGYVSISSDTKCAKRDAVSGLPFGSDCDEINERRYCAKGLICHRCSDVDAIYRCVRFSLPNVAELIAEASSFRPSLIFYAISLGFQIAASGFHCVI